jgi:plasmid stabilization system protein ParE
MTLKFHPEARAELREAKRFYRARSPLAAAAFAREVAAAVDSISAAPQRFIAGEYGTRQHVLPWRFPYTIVYMLLNNDVIVVAIAHQSRQPGYWRTRIKL